MFEFDWSFLENLPRTWKMFKHHFGISKYDIHLNKFWFKNDYHDPQSICFDDTLELLDSINILISDEATFDHDLKKCYRNVITTPNSIQITPFFYDRETLHCHTVKVALELVEKQLTADEFRTTIATRLELSGIHGLAHT